jgi:hypothetical protein
LHEEEGWDLEGGLREIPLGPPAKDNSDERYDKTQKEGKAIGSKEEAYVIAGDPTFWGRVTPPGQLPGKGEKMVGYL